MKTWIKCAIAATLGLAAGGTGGYFLGRELEKRDAEERLQTAIDEVKEVYRKDLPVVRETAADGPADASWGQKEAKQAAVTLDQEEMVKSQTAKPPLEQFIRDHTPANGAQRTNYAAIGLGVKQGPPPPPITNAFDQEGVEDVEESLKTKADEMLEEMGAVPGEAGIDPMPAGSPFVPNVHGVKGTVLPGGDAPTVPFLITEESYTNEYRHLDKRQMICYEEDHVLVDLEENPDAPVEDPARWCGSFDPVSLFWQASDNDTQPAETVWVRNFDMNCDIEIELYHRSFAETHSAMGE